MNPRSIRSGQRGAGVVALLVILVAGLTAVLVVANVLSASRLSNTQRGWDQTLGSWNEIMERFPATHANPAALEVERLAAQLGLDIAPRQYEGRVRPTDEQSQALRPVKVKLFGI